MASFAVHGCSMPDEGSVAVSLRSSCDPYNVLQKIYHT
jgi:hypothetical protein